MSENKMQPTKIDVHTFLEGVSEKRRSEAHTLISMMQTISGEKPTMWGPSIIGFGSQHYKYETGREGDMPDLAFSPRKSAITIYFSEGFEQYSEQLGRLGKYKASVSCLYINNLTDVNLDVLGELIRLSYERSDQTAPKLLSVEDYISSIPAASKAKFDQLRQLVKDTLPQAKEVFSYGIVGYKIDDKRARVFISGWKDHVALYPIPKDEALRTELTPYVKGKGTLWFSLEKELPVDLIRATILALAE